MFALLVCSAVKFSGRAIEASREPAQVYGSITHRRLTPAQIKRVSQHTNSGSGRPCCPLTSNRKSQPASRFRFVLTGQITHRARLHAILGITPQQSGQNWGTRLYTQDHRSAIVDFTNRFMWHRCRWVRAWGSRASRRPAPVLACRYTP